MDLPRTPSPPRRRSSGGGFSLIEMMVVIAILGILAAIVIPSFIRHRQETLRTTAMQCVVNGVDRQEAFFAAQNRYATNITELGLSQSCGDGGEYQMSVGAAGSCTSAAATCYRITAKAVAAAQTPDGDLILDYDSTAATPALRTTKTRKVKGVAKSW